MGKKVTIKVYSLTVLHSIGVDMMKCSWCGLIGSIPSQQTDKEGGENWLKSYTVMVGTWVNKLPLSVHQVHKEKKEVLEYLSLRIPFSECF